MSPKEKRIKNYIKYRELLYPALLLILACLIVGFSYRPGSLYGSTTDWFAQHVSLADTMRQTILEEGTLFPGRLPLGGGSNIYDFSYYGYLRPDVLLSCLLPGVAMEHIIVGYSVAGYLCAVVLFYFLLKKAGLRPKLALLGGILFLGAGCFFHIHRHIMFINYMPFLLGALLGVLRYHRTGKKGLPVLMMAMISFHSYYYAISSLLVVYLFFLYTADWEEGHKCRQWWKLTVRYARQALLSVAMAAVLLLPTACSILSSAEMKDGGSAGASPWQMTWNMESLLYQGYGLGLTLIAFFLLLLSLCRKKVRFLAAGILFALVCGLIPLILNGFLYSRAKILMPFLPLVLLLCMETLREFWSERRRPPVWALILTVWVTYLQYKSHKVVWVWVDLALVSMLFVLLFWRWRETAASGEGERQQAVSPLYRNGKLQSRLLAAVMTAMCGLICLFAFILHQNEEYISKEKTILSRFAEEEREDFYKETDYRFDTFLNPYNTGNRLLGYGAGRTSMYTSTSNPVYSEFFYDEIRTPIGSNNRVGLLNRANPFLQYLMGVRYVETTKNALPAGYEIRMEKENVVLAEREDVLPLCYGSVDLLSGEAYEKLAFPENLEALTSASVVEKSGNETEFSPHFKELHPVEGVDYKIKKTSDKEFTIIPTTPVKNQILAVTFQVRRTSQAAVTISINGIPNKLSGAFAPYPNHNENFTYLLSSNEPMKRFKVKTDGKFETGNVHIYSLDASSLGNRAVIPIKEAAKEQNIFAAAGLGQRELVRGTVTMPKDGYLITSYPIQPGYKAYVDGREVLVETVNLAFAGVPLGAGTHEVVLSFAPPMQAAGILVSAGGWLFFGGMLVLEKGKRNRKREGKEKRKMKQDIQREEKLRRSQELQELQELRELQKQRTLYAKCKELFTYGIGGVLTTLVNYIIYFGLRTVSVDYLVSNTVAWAGAVLFAFFINRKWVFASKGSPVKEFFNFTGMRLATLLVENLLLYLAVEQLAFPSSLSKILVSVVTVLANYAVCQKHIFNKQTVKDETAAREEL